MVGPRRSRADPGPVGYGASRWTDGDPAPRCDRSHSAVRCRRCHRMRLIRLDGRGPAGEDLYLHPGLTVLLGAPATTVAAVVDAARAIGDPTVVAPAGLFEVDRALGPIRALGAGGPDPVLELRSDHRPPPVPGPGVDPGAEARRVAARRIDELRSELDFVEGELRVAVRAEQLAASGAAARGDGLAEVEAAADQVSLALLQDDPGGAGTELERRLRALVAAADDAAVRAEATAWRIDELAADLAEGDLGPLERGTEHSMLLGELEALRSELLALDARGAVSPGDRERRAELEARASVLLGELGYGRYVDLLLDDGSVVRPARRDRVLDACCRPSSTGSVRTFRARSTPGPRSVSVRSCRPRPQDSSGSRWRSSDVSRRTRSPT
jgi:hypothetical protein